MEFESAKEAQEAVQVCAFLSFFPKGKEYF